MLPGFFHIGLSNAQHYEYAGPGGWNDPDYILIGYVGNARSQDDPPIPTKLTPNEQYSYMSMWCLMAAPLFFSGDMAILDDFTLGVLTSPEVIEVDQDPLGKQAKPLVQDDLTLIMAKPLEDGSLAVGLFNLADMPREMSCGLAAVGRAGQTADPRSLAAEGPGHRSQTASRRRVPRHGVALLRLRPQ